MVCTYFANSHAVPVSVEGISSITLTSSLAFILEFKCIFSFKLRYFRYFLGNFSDFSLIMKQIFVKIAIFVQRMNF